MRAVVLVLSLAACGRLGFDARGMEPDGDVDIDAPEASTRCSPALDADTVALYLLDDPLPADVTGVHTGTARMSVTASDPHCGDGSARFETGYILVPDHPELDLAAGSLEMFVRLTGTGIDNQTLVARDAPGMAMNGHFLVLVTATGELVVRIQRTNATAFRCADFAFGSWVHVGVSFGPQGLRMWMNGVPATKPTATLDAAPIDCTQPHAFGIDGNDNALVIGASNARQGTEGAVDPAIDQYVLAGNIDHVRLTRTWRDFGN